MTGIVAVAVAVAVACVCGLLVSPLLFLVAGLPRITSLLGVRDEDVARWQAWAAFSLGSVSLLGLLIVLLP